MGALLERNWNIDKYSGVKGEFARNLFTRILVVVEKAVHGVLIILNTVKFIHVNILYEKFRDSLYK
jgi:hypothetical protein